MEPMQLDTNDLLREYGAATLELKFLRAQYKALADAYEIQRQTILALREPKADESADEDVLPNEVEGETDVPKDEAPAE